MRIRRQNNMMMGMMMCMDTMRMMMRAQNAGLSHIVSE